MDRSELSGYRRRWHYLFSALCFFVVAFCADCGGSAMTRRTNDGLKRIEWVENGAIERQNKIQIKANYDRDDIMYRDDG
jgi:hypothetical protein